VCEAHSIVAEILFAFISFAPVYQRAARDWAHRYGGSPIADRPEDSRPSLRLSRWLPVRLLNLSLREFFWISAICMTTEKFAADILRRLLHVASVMGWQHALNSGGPVREHNLEQGIW
jgi:hypothetical protein